MKLKRLNTDVGWLLDDRYEIELSYNHGYKLSIRDRQDTYEKCTPDYKKFKNKPKVSWLVVDAPKEHSYFFGTGRSSDEYGLHNYPCGGTNCNPENKQKELLKEIKNGISTDNSNEEDSEVKE